MQKKISIGILLGGILIGSARAEGASTSLGVLLTADPRVPVAARNALIEEATRIWDSAGVRLEWIPSSAPRPTTGPTLRVLAIPWRQTSRPGEANVLGELVRVNESDAVVMLSLDRAEGMASRLPPRAATSREERLGIILGRATAHEIGHFLLDKSTHARRGLMRAAFNERAFADPQSSAFELDGQARAWVRERVAHNLPLGPGAATLRVSALTLPAGGNDDADGAYAFAAPAH